VEILESIISTRLKEVRISRKLSQIDVMKLTQIHNKTLSGYENGVSEPDIETLKKLVKVYDCSLDYLIGLSNKPDLDVQIPVLHPDEIGLLEKYRKLDDIQKDTIKRVIDTIISAKREHAID
jgi:transcriptional regulator with XRE-family HTH domain